MKRFKADIRVTSFISRSKAFDPEETTGCRNRDAFQARAGDSRSKGTFQVGAGIAKRRDALQIGAGSGRRKDAFQVGG